jgi:septum site-determining protein MinC
VGFALEWNINQGRAEGERKITMTSNTSLPLKIKAKRDGFILVPDAAASFESVKAFLEQRIRESHDFFSCAEMILDLTARPMHTSEISELHGLLVEKAGVKLIEVRLNDDLSLVLERSPVRPVTPARPLVSLNRNQESCPMIVRNTCRSGIRIESPADCIVLGDVNPGAEIVAMGDVVVFGNLRGIAHAGAGGDRSARIWALSIEPSQIRIADMVAVPPRGSKPMPKRFEIAEIQQGLIEVITM